MTTNLKISIYILIVQNSVNWTKNHTHMIQRKIIIQPLCIVCSDSQHTNLWNKWVTYSFLHWNIV